MAKQNLKANLEVIGGILVVLACGIFVVAWVYHLGVAAYDWIQREEYTMALFPIALILAALGFAVYGFSKLFVSNKGS